MSEAVKETKAQRVERLKRELNPWAAYAEIERFAREGFESIPAEWLNTYFRWWGIYTQGDGVGAVGGKGGEGSAVPYFMLRIRIPNGILVAPPAPRASPTSPSATPAAWPTSPCARTSSSTGCGSRVCPTIVSALARVGISSLGTCGDVTRNITGLPGGRGRRRRDRGRLAPGRRGHRDAQRQPRVLQPAAQVQGLHRRLPGLVHVPGDQRRGAHRRPPSPTPARWASRCAWAAGSPPIRISRPRLDAFVRWDQALAVVKAVAEIFRDSDVLRENREKARLKFLFLRHGWTPERFRDEIDARLGLSLDPAVPETPPEDVVSRPRGAPAAEAAGLVYAGLPILRGRLAPDQMRAVAGLAERFGTGELRTTTMQNLVIVNVPRARAGELERASGRAPASRWPPLPSAAAPWPARAASSASSRSPRPRGSPAGSVEELEARLPGFERARKHPRHRLPQ